MRFLYGRTAVITGAGSGIGRACAEAFAAQGYSVWALHRRAAGPPAPTAAGGRITPLACDVRDEDSVRGAVARVAAQEGAVGLVLHCAGFGISGAAEDVSLEAARAQMETNYFGVLRVNRHILPLMRARGGGLVLVVGSVAGHFAIPFQSHYASSKHALKAYVEALRMEGAPFGLRAALLEPGDTKTGFTAARAPAGPADSPYAPACARAVARMARDETRGHDPAKAARAALALARRRRPPVRRVVGLSYKFLVFAKRLLPARLVEFVLTRLYLRGAAPPGGV
ncbi:MAG: SDR family NAD(P)-dependent oxidoreductase [Oscillospiraceae bacterium]|jgi:NAD(P)-dependent dehydrogenase (short-subunit alcohol dehydrogenase family)|nr:SDR family NAD(P)-dependent oxidoreductase [Oscillospiraceae bacterium]